MGKKKTVSCWYCHSEYSDLEMVSEKRGQFYLNQRRAALVQRRLDLSE